MEESTLICFSSYEGSTGFLVTTDHAGSQPACAVELRQQFLSARLQDGICFFQRSSARHPDSSASRRACLDEAE